MEDREWLTNAVNTARMRVERDEQLEADLAQVRAERDEARAERDVARAALRDARNAARVELEERSATIVALREAIDSYGDDLHAALKRAAAAEEAARLAEADRDAWRVLAITETRGDVDELWRAKKAAAEYLRSRGIDPATGRTDGADGDDAG